ncbi:MAG: HD domain-containing protein [Candidatus Moranbacteria bacterium]|nr:HD domain-containing protein [Candidatus Moranbacteria bacterium]
MNPGSLLKGRNVDPIIEAYFQIGHLKQLYRRGWLRKNRVSEAHCESVADHCFGMMILAILIIDRFGIGLDFSKVARMIVLHELGEVYGGDITPVDGISDGEKYRIERDSVKRIFETYPGGEVYVDMWEEYDAKTTKEAKFVAQIDKLEMAFQASVYRLQHGADLDAFMESARDSIQSDVLVCLFEEIRGMI